MCVFQQGLKDSFEQGKAHSVTDLECTKSVWVTWNAEWDSCHRLFLYKLWARLVDVFLELCKYSFVRCGTGILALVI